MAVSQDVPALDFQGSCVQETSRGPTNADDDMEGTAVEEEMEACQADDAVYVISSLSSETIADNDQYL